MNISGILNITGVEFKSILGRRGIRSIALLLALFLFTKGCDSFFTLMNRVAQQTGQPVEIGILPVRYTIFLMFLVLFGIFIAVFLGGYLVETDIRRKYILNILSKPLTRTEYFLGKILGVLLYLFLYSAFCFVYFLINFRVPLKDIGADHILPFIFLGVVMLVEFSVALILSLLFHPLAATLLGLGFYFTPHILVSIIILTSHPYLHKVLIGIYYFLPSVDRINIPMFGIRMAKLSGFIPSGAQAQDPRYLLLISHNVLYALMLILTYLYFFRRKSVVAS